MQTPTDAQRLTARTNRRLRLTGADGGYGRETESAVSEFKQELIDLAGEEGVSTELQSCPESAKDHEGSIDALVVASFKRPKVSPVITPEEIEEPKLRGTKQSLSEMYDEK